LHAYTYGDADQLAEVDSDTHDSFVGEAYP
jgi:hypothetical protein